MEEWEKFFYTKLDDPDQSFDDDHELNRDREISDNVTLGLQCVVSEFGQLYNGSICDACRDVTGELWLRFTFEKEDPIVKVSVWHDDWCRQDVICGQDVNISVLSLDTRDTAAARHSHLPT